MDQSGHTKLLKAGFTIIRERTNYPVGGDLNYPRYDLVAKTPDQHEWHIIEKDLKSKAGRERRKKELLKDPKIVED